MFGKKDSPTYVPVERMTDATITRLATLTSGQVLKNPDQKNTDTNGGITYPRMTIIFDRTNHILELKEGAGARQFDTTNGVVYQDTSAEQIVFLLDSHLGVSDTHEHRVVPVKLTISREGMVHQENLFSDERANYLGSPSNEPIL